MAGSHSTTPLVVRERFSFWPHFGAGLAAFLVTGLTVHFFAQHGMQRATRIRCQPVQVRVEVPDDLLAGLRDGNTPDAIQNLSTHFRRPELLRQAWQEFTAGRQVIPGGVSAQSPGTCEQFTSSLRVQALKTEEGCRFNLQLNSRQPREAAEYLKILARQFIRQNSGKSETLETAETPPRELPPQAIQVVLPTEIDTHLEGGLRLLGLSLGSGLTMAIGVCLVSLGASLEPLVARLADLKRLLRVPILGIVPRRDPDDPSGKQGRRRGICRWTLLLSGLVLIGGATTAILMIVYQYTVS